jgi:YkoY family integral membrane protein
MDWIKFGVGVRVKREPLRYDRIALLDIAAPDLVTVALLVGLEGLLSADNALVMAIMVLGLPRSQHKKALRYGLVGGFAFRIAATLLATYLIRVAWIKLLGGLYLLYLTYSHFWGQAGGADSRTAPRARPWLGLSAFWATVVRVELINLAFSVDSILVAVAMSPKRWVVITGGILGIVAMRVVVGQLIVLVERYPTLVDGAFVIIAWVGLKLGLEYLHALGYVHFEISQWLSIGLIVAIFLIALLYARMQGPAAHVNPLTEQAEEILDRREG